YETFEQQVVITPGGNHAVQVQLARRGPEGGPCGEFGPEYNRDNICFDTRPTPLTATFIAVPADAPIFPREAILLIKVSPTGETEQVRVSVGSNVETFTTQALDMARALRWNPATKNNEPVEAWVQWRFVPVRR
ncbi:MAG: energy transducer TonB, partial [Gemmatimonadales bacterium]